MMRKLGTMILVILLLCSCKGKDKEEETTFDLAGKTYYNTVDNYGHEDHAKVWFGKDGSFVMNDSYDGGYYDVTGSWSVSENVCSLQVSDTGQGSFSSVIFEIKDDDTLVLKTNLVGSASDDIFSINEIKGSSKDDSGKKEDPKPDDGNKEVPCTAIYTLYKSYWAEEGTKSWHLDIKPIPENTTDKMTYKSNDEEIVKIDENGNVTTGKIGKTTIEVTCGSQKITIGFETRADGPTSLVLNPATIMIYPGDYINLKVDVYPETAEKKYTFTSADPAIATVDKEGKVVGVSPGLTEIIVKAENGVSAVCKVFVEGETVIFEMENYATVKAASGEKIPYKATWIMYYEGNVTKNDVTNEVQFHTAYTSALDIDGHGNVYAKGSIYETTDIPVTFSFSDGGSLYVESQTFYVRVVKE